MNPNYFNGYLTDTMAGTPAPIEVPIKLVGEGTAHSYATTDRVVVTGCRLETDTNGVYRVYLDDSADGTGTGDDVVPIITTIDGGANGVHEHIQTHSAEMFFSLPTAGTPSAWKIWVLGPANADVTVHCCGYLMPNAGYNQPG